MEYDFFMVFEGDMQIAANHVLKSLEMSANIDRARRDEEMSLDG